MSLTLRKKNLFAWIAAPMHRYRDFILEAETQFAEDNGYSAVGFLLRHAGDDSFYYFLISNRGYFRFNAVINGNPVPLIDWTPAAAIGAKANRLRIIGRDRHFAFFVDDDWVGEVDDETLAEGCVGFAAQNFDEKDVGVFAVRKLIIESRPLEVERNFLRWTRHIPVEPKSRIELARSFFRRGEFAAAVVQLKKALKNHRGTAQDYALLGECLINLQMYEAALRAVDRALELQPALREAAHERANLLYLLGRAEEAASQLGKTLVQDPGNSALWNLLGNTEYGRGRWEAASTAYQKALILEPDNPLFNLNAARSAEAEGKRDEALRFYLRAADLFFRGEAMDDLRQILPCLKRLGAEPARLVGLEAKMLYADGRTAEAEPLLRRALEGGDQEDSSLCYLLGLIHIERGERWEAHGLLETACGIEPDYPLYRMRLAENLFLMGEDAGEEIRRAHRMAPEDPWVSNLYGQYLMARAEWREAAPYLKSAFEAAPAESPILINYTECLASTGRADEALRLLSDGLEDGPSAALQNQLGNLLARKARYPEALAAYEEAVRLAPDEAGYAKNLAAVCIELDMVLRAEEILAELEQRFPQPDVYNLIGHLALIQGQHQRAEASLARGLELEPEDPGLQTNLACLRLARREVVEARRIVDAVLAGNPGFEPALKLRDRIRADFEEELHCGGCDLSWRVPVPLPPQPSLRIVGEPPDDCPAGQCPSCGRIYCVRCAREHLRASRFVCPQCDVFLKLGDDRLKHLVSRFIGG